MNRPITLCDRCEEYTHCCLNYDGGNCRRSRTVEPTNADRIRSMTDEELAMWINDVTTNALSVLALGSNKQTKNIFYWLDWLKQEVKEASDG